MKRTLRKSMAVLMVVAMILTINTTIFAESGKTVNVKGYIGEWMDEEEIAQVTDHLSVTNVIETLDAKAIDENLSSAFVVQSPSTITVLVENGDVFAAYKLIPKGEGVWEIPEGQELPISGQALVWEIDPSGAEDEFGFPLVIEKTIDASEAKNHADDQPMYLPGCSVKLTEPGEYYVVFRREAAAGATQVFIRVEGTNASVEEPVQEPVENPVQEPVQSNLTASPTASKVLVNGEETSFDAYNIDGSNYFKLRDLAKVVSGTEKQFEVEWDGEMKAINLISNTAYTVVGGEMEKGDGQAKTATLNSSKIYKDGEEVQLTAYTINGNNYFKLRDLAQAFDIGVTWDNATKTIGIDTSIGYIAE